VHNIQDFVLNIRSHNENYNIKMDEEDQRPKTPSNSENKKCNSYIR